MKPGKGKIIELPALHNRVRVFKDRRRAGGELARMLGPYITPDCIVFAIPSGGVPVAVEISRELGAPLDVFPVSKITLPWNTEAGYGAVAFNGVARFNRALISRLSLSEDEVREGSRATLEKVRRRAAKFRGDKPLPTLSGRTAILVDDGIASGFTILTGVEALRSMDPDRVLTAAPTGSMESVGLVASQSNLLFCANIREGLTFAVADAYEEWSDIEEDDAVAQFRAFQQENAIMS